MKLLGSLLDAPKTEDSGIAIVLKNGVTGEQKEIDYETADKDTQVNILSNLLVKTAISYVTPDEVVIFVNVFPLIHRDC